MNEENLRVIEGLVNEAIHDWVFEGEKNPLVLRYDPETKWITLYVVFDNRPVRAYTAQGV